MSWDGMFPAETEQALQARARNPAPARPPRVSGWAQLGEIVAAPFKGAGQGALQTTRNVNAAAGMAGVSGIDPREDLEGYLAEQDLSRRGAAMADPMLRRGIDRLKPDAQTSTLASTILQDASRVLTKVGGYSLVAGVPGAIAGTGADEGVTGYLELRDRGVDPGTAAKVGAVRGATMAAGVALPVAGSTLARSAGLALAGGPGTFVAEQALTRKILEDADYPELAAEHDPFDPVGLGVSALIPAVFGGAVHAARARRARSEAAPLADTPEVVDAAHVAYQQQAIDVAMLGDRADPAVRAGHAQALDAAARALDEGDRVQIAPLDLDPVKAQRVVDEMAGRLRAVEAETAALRATEPPPLPELPPTVIEPAPVEAAAPPTLIDRVRQVLGMEDPAPPPEPQVSPSMQRATRIATDRPDMPVRLDDDGLPASAGDVLVSVREEAQRSRTESRAFEAAVECFLRTGS